jgi:hypothetical protein
VIDFTAFRGCDKMGFTTANPLNLSFKASERFKWMFLWRTEKAVPSSKGLERYVQRGHFVICLSLGCAEGFDVLPTIKRHSYRRSLNDE